MIKKIQIQLGLSKGLPRLIKNNLQDLDFNWETINSAPLKFINWRFNIHYGENRDTIVDLNPKKYIELYEIEDWNLQSTIPFLEKYEKYEVCATIIAYLERYRIAMNELCMCNTQRDITPELGALNRINYRIVQQEIERLDNEDNQI